RLPLVIARWTSPPQNSSGDPSSTVEITFALRSRLAELTARRARRCHCTGIDEGQRTPATDSELVNGVQPEGRLRHRCHSLPFARQPQVTFFTRNDLDTLSNRPSPVLHIRFVALRTTARAPSNNGHRLAIRRSERLQPPPIRIVDA